MLSFICLPRLTVQLWDPGVMGSPSAHKTLVSQLLNIGNKRKASQKCLWGCWQKPLQCAKTQNQYCFKAVPVAAGEKKPGHQDSFYIILLNTSLLTCCPGGMSRDRSSMWTSCLTSTLTWVSSWELMNGIVVLWLMLIPDIYKLQDPEE